MHHLLSFFCNINSGHISGGVISLRLTVRSSTVVSLIAGAKKKAILCLKYLLSVCTRTPIVKIIVYLLLKQIFASFACAEQLENWFNSVVITRHLLYKNGTHLNSSTLRYYFQRMSGCVKRSQGSYKIHVSRMILM